MFCSTKNFVFRRVDLTELASRKGTSQTELEAAIVYREYVTSITSREIDGK